MRNLLLLVMLLLFLLLILLMMSSPFSSFRTLPESMFKLPMMASYLLGPLFEIGEFFTVLKLFNGGVPTRFETWKEGSVFGLMAVLRPEVLVIGLRISDLLRPEE